MQESCYHQSLHHKNIIICGPMPPPLGGIAVHLQRMVAVLKRHRNRVHVFDATRYKNPLQRWSAFAYLIFTQRPDQVHYHTLYHHCIEWLLVIIGKWCLRYQLILIDHDCRDLYKRGRFTKFLLKKTMSSIDHHVIMGATVEKSYHDNNIPLAAKNFIETPFLPPELSQETEILATYPETLFTFLAQHSPLIAINAFRLVLLDGKDLYGIDQALTMITALRHHYPHIGLVIVLATRGNEQYFSHLKNFIAKNNLHEAIFWLEGQRQLWPLLKKVDLFVRPTLSDNYGISIAEALYCQTAALASDVCERPVGTLLYQAGNVDHFIDQVYFLLKKERAHGTSDRKCHYLYPQSPARS